MEAQEQALESGLVVQVQAMDQEELDQVLLALATDLEELDLVGLVLAMDQEVMLVPKPANMVCLEVLEVPLVQGD